LKTQQTRNKSYYIAAAVALMTVIVYLPTLRNGFVIWDDNQYIFENPSIRSLDAAFFRWAFLGFHAGNWHPLAWISHAVDYAIWGMDPVGHHLTSIILHAVNAALVVVLALKLLEIARQRSVQNTPASFLNDRTVAVAAGVTGLLFGIHPVHVESVAWAAERKDLLCALFFLLSIMMYVKYADSQVLEEDRREGSGQKIFLSHTHYLLSLGFFIFSLLSKPMAVSLPAVLLILDWHPFERIQSLKTFRTVIAEKLPFIALSLVSSTITIMAQEAGRSIVPIEQITLSERALVATKALAAYLGKMLLPVNLLPFYPYPKVVPLFSFEYLLAIGLVIGVTATCAILLKKQKLWLSAWGFYVITLIPVLGIVQAGGQAMADRYTYLPSLGPFLVAGLCGAWIAENFIVKQKNASVKIVCSIAALFVLVVLSYATFKQIHAWYDDFTLWDHAIKKSSEKVSMAYAHRGVAYGKKGLIDRAIADLEMAINLNPSDYDAYYDIYMNLGAAFGKKGQSDKALENVEKAINVKPSSHEAYIYRGVLHEEMGHLDKAIADYTEAITLDPSDIEAFNNRGIAFGKSGQLDKAIADYSETIRLNPRHIDAHSNRGVAYTLTGQYDKALDDFNTSVILGPNDPMAYYNRGSFYRRTGKKELAFADFQKACNLRDERACGMLSQLKGPGPR
jgi:protein O-mannosyl-transferase